MYLLENCQKKNTFYSLSRLKHILWFSTCLNCLPIVLTNFLSAFPLLLEVSSFPIVLFCPIVLNLLNFYSTDGPNHFPHDDSELLFALFTGVKTFPYLSFPPKKAPKVRTSPTQSFSISHVKVDYNLMIKVLKSNGRDFYM